MNRKRVNCAANCESPSKRKRYNGTDLTLCLPKFEQIKEFYRKLKDRIIDNVKRLKNVASRWNRRGLETVRGGNEEEQGVQADHNVEILTNEDNDVMNPEAIRREIDYYPNLLDIRDRAIEGGAEVRERFKEMVHEEHNLSAISDRSESVHCFMGTMCQLTPRVQMVEIVRSNYTRGEFVQMIQPVPVHLMFAHACYGNEREVVELAANQINVQFIRRPPQYVEINSEAIRKEVNYYPNLMDIRDRAKEDGEEIRDNFKGEVANQNDMSDISEGSETVRSYMGTLCKLTPRVQLVKTMRANHHRVIQPAKTAENPIDVQFLRLTRPHVADLVQAGNMVPAPPPKTLENETVY
ncbi:unnamed protein product [Caenorhabditis angaria]|uniref:Uncharacterized protein n=1 Tax=Caenorhabditis angaria TaxID=860376 RepID=A0A9P1N2S3_9PELO|nr:unnamed protein product [Caenorhabditis angaria]